MITRKTKYALSAMVYLARKFAKGPILVSDLARDEGIPQKFLEAILLDLKKQGFLQSKRGRGGGYELAKAPKLIRMGQIIRLMEGPLAPIPCVSVTAYQPCDDCINEEACGIHVVMKQVRDATARILDNTTLADVVSATKKKPGNNSRGPGVPPRGGKYGGIRPGGRSRSVVRSRCVKNADLNSTTLRNRFLTGNHNLKALRQE